MFKAVFLDRDGVINEEKKDYVKQVNELKILSDVPSSVKKLKDAGFIVVVITNQSAINRGLTNHQEVKKIHSNIQEYLKQYGTTIDAFYYCPHRPDENCNCRKPKPGLLKKAVLEMKIDPKSSWMIGDSDSDVLAAEKIGCKAIKLNHQITLRLAVDKILRGS